MCVRSRGPPTPDGEGMVFSPPIYVMVWSQVYVRNGYVCGDLEVLER